MRTVAVFVGGVALSFLVTAMLVGALMPHYGELIVALFNTPPNSPKWHDLWIQWQHFTRIGVYVIGPLTGLAVGIFVGMAQRNRPVPLALCCLAPEFLLGFLGDRAKNWSNSISGILFYVLDQSYPFVAAAIAAYLLHRLAHPHQASTE